MQKYQNFSWKNNKFTNYLLIKFLILNLRDIHDYTLCTMCIQDFQNGVAVLTNQHGID